MAVSSAEGTQGGCRQWSWGRVVLMLYCAALGKLPEHSYSTQEMV
jgi:hypothetical protein